jgi:hypothetical protein
MTVVFDFSPNTCNTELAAAYQDLEAYESHMEFYLDITYCDVDNDCSLGSYVFVINLRGCDGPGHLLTMNQFVSVMKIRAVMIGTTSIDLIS